MPWAAILKAIIPWILRFLSGGLALGGTVAASQLTNDPTWSASTMSYVGSAWGAGSIAALLGSFLPIFGKDKLKDLDVTDIVTIFTQKLTGVQAGKVDVTRLRGVLQLIVSAGELAKALLEKLPAIDSRTP